MTGTHPKSGGVQGTDERGVPKEYPTVLAWLDDARVVSFRHKDGKIRVRESCDHYFHAYLTPAQLLQLADELREMAAVGRQT